MRETNAMDSMESFLKYISPSNCINLSISNELCDAYPKKYNVNESNTTTHQNDEVPRNDTTTIRLNTTKFPLVVEYNMNMN